jgi:Xaa-Pro aminopeptidase
MLIERGIRAPVVLVAADERIGRYRHPIPTSSRFDRYGMAVIGGERGGLIASCTRLFSFGPIGSDLRRRHEAVCKIDAAMIGHTRPGRTLGEVFAVARQAYAEAGFPDEWKRHHQGGPTGYLAREAKASPDNPTEVLSNQAFAWNPSIAGTKSEDTILVGPGGTEILTATGQWPATSYPAGGRDWERPNILAV